LPAEPPPTITKSYREATRSDGALRLRRRQLLLRGLLLGVDERLGHHHSRHGLARALDLELGAQLGVLGGHHGVADVLLEPRRVARGRDLADAAAVLVD